ncbi:MAG TPA: thiamine pyrophosphate-dependent enzyme [Flavobacterium sp.]
MAQLDQTQNPMNAKKGLLFFYQMLLIRRFEEKAAEQCEKGKIIGFLHLYIGEEAIAVGVTQALRDDDTVLSSYSVHGHALARGIDADVIMAEMYGKAEGCSRGRGGAVNLFDASNNFYGRNGIVSSHLPIGVGMALASKKQKKTSISCCFFGESAADEGAFHEAMNLASLWKVPVLFVCQNNKYAMGTAIKHSRAVTEIEKKATTYGMESAVVDGMDLMAIAAAADKAVEKIRSSGKPYFLICNTYRFGLYPLSDTELYRDKKQAEEWKKRDPILQFEQFLLQHQWITESEIAEFESKIETKIKIALDFAEAGTWEPLDQLTKFVYNEPAF